MFERIYDSLCSFNEGSDCSFIVNSEAIYDIHGGNMDAE